MPAAALTVALCHAKTNPRQQPWGANMEVQDPAPFTRLMGMKIISRSAERTESELVIREELCNRHGVIHGGAVMAWGDTLGGMTAVSALAEGQRTATIESKTNFFAPIPKGDTARAVCTPLHSGRTTIVLQTNITRSDGRLAAIVTQTQIVLPAKKQGAD
jgi:1,4-dihydroxy-2-naphthoyl-CoA hydrolase